MNANIWSFADFLDRFFGMLVPPQDFVFIADESGISNDRYTVVGGLCMHRDTLQRSYATMAEYREKHNMKSELKWQKVSNQKQAEYETLMDYFFALNNANHIHFNAIIFDSHQWKHKLYQHSDDDIGLSKLYYQLLLHKFVEKYGNKGSLYIFALTIEIAKPLLKIYGRCLTRPLRATTTS